MLRRLRPEEDNNEATFTAIDFPDASFTTAQGINPRGDIVGQYDETHGFLLSGGEFATLDFPGLPAKN